VDVIFNECQILGNGTYVKREEPQLIVSGSVNFLWGSIFTVAKFFRNFAPGLVVFLCSSDLVADAVD
jgi:hypothetical protein